MTDLNPCHPAEQQARQDELDRFYEADGRHDPAHPHHATYTGLVATPEPSPATEASDETITITRAAFDDMREWIETGLDLDWWHENDEFHEEQPETWELAQRVAKHLWLGDCVAPASEEAAADG